MTALPSDDEAALRAQRRQEYARATAVLEEDHDVPGAAGLFEQALCNGLAVIVSARWPGSEVDPKGKVKSAKSLLEVVVAAEAENDNKGPSLFLDEPDATPPVPAIHIPGEPAPEEKPGVLVEVKVLRKALEATAPRRHGKLSTKALEAEQVEALAKLDAHPALSSLYTEYGDQQQAKERVRDLWRRAQAEAYLELLSEEEIARRVEAADDLLPFDPKDRLDNPGLQECPICDQEALLPRGLDAFGIGIGVGMCFVCGYYRGADVADDEAMTFMWNNKWQYE